MALKQFSPHQAIEQLHFTVKPELIERFIELDTMIWTKRLSQFDGFIKKEIWVSDDKKGELYTVTYWEDKAKWDSIDPLELAALAKEFDAAMGSDSYTFNKPLHLQNQRYKVCETKI